VRDELVWIDCEMTGLDLKTDRLIEIAVLVTDADLNILGDGIDVVIHTDDAALSAMIPVVTDMHTRSGLIEEVRASTVDLAAAEELVLDYIRTHVKQAKTAPLAGNSIATDRGFIARDMAKLDNFLHYRNRGDRRPTRISEQRLGGNRFGCGAPQRLISTTPHVPDGRGNGGCSSVGRAPGCDPGCRGFESRQPPDVGGSLGRGPGLLVVDELIGLTQPCGNLVPEEPCRIAL
jgi:oligoribonuclease (3'-5' exoribonuclease)